VTAGKGQQPTRNWKKYGIFSVALSGAFFAYSMLAEAQQTTKIPRIGLLNSNVPDAFRGRTDSFRQGLQELGYVEGRNIVIDYRYAEGKVERLPALAAELVAQKVDVIVTAVSSATRAAKDATNTIPIVMAQDNDPVGTGAVASLARPGGNVTGLSSLSLEIGGKQLELLKEIVPSLARVTVLGTSTAAPAHALRTKEIEHVAAALKVQFQYIDVLETKDIEAAFRTAMKGRAGGMLVMGGLVLTAHRTDVAKLAAKNRLPAIFNVPEFVEVGGLMTYGASYNDLYRRAATYVDKILKGAKPGNLPVEQPTKFELVINLKAAKQIGLRMPPNVVARADRVIK
jgi:ABC-type uncharacterized transport system substrate-binding protein